MMTLWGLPLIGWQCNGWQCCCIPIGLVQLWPDLGSADLLLWCVLAAEALPVVEEGNHHMTRLVLFTGLAHFLELLAQKHDSHWRESQHHFHRVWIYQNYLAFLTYCQPLKQATTNGQPLFSWKPRVLQNVTVFLRTFVQLLQLQSKADFQALANFTCYK